LKELLIQDARNDGGDSEKENVDLIVSVDLSTSDDVKTQVDDNSKLTIDIGTQCYLDQIRYRVTANAATQTD